MLIPQFSLRRMLIAVTGLSVVFLVLAQAVDEHPWAVGVIVGLLSLLAIALTHGFTFFLVWLFAAVTAKRKATKAKSITTLLLALLATQEALAAGGAHTLPMGPNPSPSGLTVALDTTWPEGLGYRPITFTVTSLPPAKADRTLSFECQYHAWNPKQPWMTVKTDLDIPAGAAQATKTVAVPDFSYWDQYSLDTWEDGQHQPTLSSKNLNTGGLFYYDSPELMPACLFVAAAEPDATSFNALFPTSQYNAGSNAPSTSFSPYWAWRTPAALPAEWLCYQSLDLLFIALTDLKALPAPQLTAIRDWTRTGGNLIVVGVGTDWSGLEPLDKLLNLAPGKHGSAWQSPDGVRYQDSFADIIWPDDRSLSTPKLDADGNPIPEVEVTIDPPENAPFRSRPCQQGMVVALSPGDPLKSFDSSDWYWMMNALGSARWLGIKRTGISYQGENLDFWTFLIPGVGGAPVNAYRVLISVFVVLIGPVNYLLLRKHRRLHLLLFTVPASALLVTAGLLAYAVLADGLHTRVRSRSFTLLDQRTGDAVSWARLAYYSGLAPSGGLQFEHRVAPIPYPQHSEPFSSREHRVFDVRPNLNRLARGWLPSRTPTQFLTAHPYRTDQKLVVREKPDGTWVQNQLGRSIQHLLVCNKAGTFGYGTHILPDQLHPLDAVTAPDTSGGSPAIADMRVAFNAQTLSLPDGFDSRGGRQFFTFGLSFAHGQNHTAVLQSESRLEAGLEAAQAAVVQAGITGQAGVLAPGSYIAIIDRPEQVPLGLDNVEETAGFHVVRGTW